MACELNNSSVTGNLCTFDLLITAPFVVLSIVKGKRMKTDSPLYLEVSEQFPRTDLHLVKTALHCEATIPVVCSKALAAHREAGQCWCVHVKAFSKEEL